MNESIVNNMNSQEIARLLEDGNPSSKTLEKAIDYLLEHHDETMGRDDRIESHVHDSMCDEYDKEIEDLKTKIRDLKAELDKAIETIANMECEHEPE